jgi:hypothetical protein
MPGEMVRRLEIVTEVLGEAMPTAGAVLACETVAVHYGMG